MVKKVKFNPQAIIDEQVENIDEALETIEAKMKPYARLAEKKNQLLSARRALLGTGSRNTGNAGTRLTLDDVVNYFTKHPGAVVSSVAEEFGVSQSTVSSHIYRNKDRFLKSAKTGGYHVRDPEAGLNTEADLEEDDE